MLGPSTLPKPLRGIIPPMITPLSDRDTLDHAGLEHLLEHLLAGGVEGLFILGTSGEGPSLSHRLRCELIERVCDQVAGRVPVLVGVTDTSFVESIEMAGHAADHRASAVVLSAPYYFPAGQSELLQYVRHIVPEIELPVFLYNMPSHTKLSFEIDTLRRLINVPNIVGMKDSSGDMKYFHRVARIVSDRPDFSLLVGPEVLLGDAILAGAHGGVCGGANLAPRMFVKLYEAAAAGDLPRMRELHARAMRLAETIYAVGEFRSSFIKGVKCALSCMGICDDAMAEPFQRFDQPEREQIDRFIWQLGIKPEITLTPNDAEPPRS